MNITLKPDTLDLTIILPSLDEAENLRVLLPHLQSTLDEINAKWEVLVIDGHDCASTREIVEQISGCQYIHEAERGYGRAILRGISEAHGKWVLTMDADQSHPAVFIPALWNARDQAELLIASRYVDGGHADQPLFRLLLSRVLNRFFRFGLSLSVRDMSSGFRLYRKSIFRDMDIEFTNFVLLIEVLLETTARGYRIVEIPFHYKPRQEGTSHARIFRFGLDYLRLFRRMWRKRNSIAFADYDWRAYDSRIPVQRYWQRKRHTIITRMAHEQGLILDAGCGSSHILADISNAIGLDIQYGKLAFMRRTQHPLVQASVMQIPFADAAFDCVICSQVLEHIPDEDGRMIPELCRVLRPGGTLIVGTPDYGTWRWRVIERIYGAVAPGAYADEHVTRYSCEQLCQTLEKNRLHIEEIRYICGAELIIKARLLQ